MGNVSKAAEQVTGVLSICPFYKQDFIFSLRKRTDHYFKVKHITLMSSARWALEQLCAVWTQV